MSVPEKRRNRTGFWTNEKVQKFFDALCEKTQIVKVSIDWSKFRELDKKNHFGPYSNAYLSLMHMKRRREKEGKCVQCGKNKMMKGKKICSTCFDSNRDRYLESC